MPRIDKHLEDKPAARLKPAPAMTEPGLQDETTRELQRIDAELKRQTENFRRREKGEANAGRPADARLKAERKGVL